VTDSDVLIVGAGPTGLVLALWLTRCGVSVRIIDRTAEPGSTSRALAVQARTLELYRQLDLADTVVKRGYKVPAVNLWARGEHAARLGFESVGSQLTPFPFLEIFPQDQHERLLIERLQSLGVTVERRSEFLGFSDTGERISARLLGADGREESCECCYLAGCDGARSRVREVLGVDFPGGTYRQLFYVADVEGDGPAVNAELNVDLDEADFLGIFPLAGARRARLIGTVRDERADRPESLRFEDVSGRAMAHLKLEVRKVNWFSTYHVHHRVAGHFASGRAFLLGDAAHIHSPVGGQGMNTGIGDAVNLAWKLAAVLSGRATQALLETYEPERIGFARRLVGTTDRIFSFVSADGWIADAVRTRLVPLVLPGAIALEPVREFLFRTVSQIMINYRGTTLSAGSAGQVYGGDRLPWVASGSTDNHASLQRMLWQVHVYGSAAERLREECAKLRLPLQEFPWTPAHQAAGLRRDALYLLRPDTYVALADPDADPVRLDRYFTERNLQAGTPEGVNA
jgi:2-polyprenyl-6-methoxyphenol hydroxylase-like FAD-dependent oxidoreductase